MHVVSADGEDASCGPVVIVDDSERVLYVAVVTHVQAVDLVEVRLVVLVERVGDFEVVT